MSDTQLICIGPHCLCAEADTECACVGSGPRCEVCGAAFKRIDIDSGENAE